MSPPTPIAFLDSETTGLDPDRHEMWELAIILRRPGDEPLEQVWQFPVALVTAEPTALRINHFWERHTEVALEQASPALEIAKAREIATLLDGAFLVGSIPSFDAGFLDRHLRRWSAGPSWQYRLVCVESLAAGRLGIRPPWSTDELGERLGCPKDPSTQHTALGDARWAMKVYDAVFTDASPPSRARAAKAAPAPAPNGSSESGAEAAPEAPGEPSASPKSQAPSTTEPSACATCGAEVDPRQALVSYSLYRRVLCMAGDQGGCFGRMKLESTAARA